MQLSTSHFFRAFRQTFGESPHAYIMQRRIRRAQELMLTSRLPLSQVALECGMCDQAHFSRAFRRIVGTNPNAWRRQFLVGPAPDSSVGRQIQIRTASMSPATGSQDFSGALPSERGRRGFAQISKREHATNAGLNRTERPLFAESEPPMGAHIVAELISLARLGCADKVNSSSSKL